MERSGKGHIKSNLKHYFDIDFYEWKMLPETKVINGITCQKATYTVRNILIWEVWFTPNIPTQTGIVGMIGVPGLVFEAENKSKNTSYVLESYKIGAEIPEKVFQLEELSQRFDMQPKPVKSSSNPVQSKIQRQAELTNQ